MKTLFDALDAADKYSLLARCDLEGLLLRVVSGLDAFAIGYYHSDRQALHATLVRDYAAPNFVRAPTPYVFSPMLLTDIPRDVAQALIRDGNRRMLSCGCKACAELIRSAVTVSAAALGAAHFYASMTKLEQQFDDEESDWNANAATMHELLLRAEDRVPEVLVPTGTFAHLQGWRKWLEHEFGIE